MFKVNDNVVLSGCPYDEQISGEAMKYASMKDKAQVVTEVKDASGVEGTSGQWIKTDKEPDWIDAYWYKGDNDA